MDVVTLGLGIWGGALRVKSAGRVEAKKRRRLVLQANNRNEGLEGYAVNVSCSDPCLRIPAFGSGYALGAWAEHWSLLRFNLRCFGLHIVSCRLLATRTFPEIAPNRDCMFAS